MTAANRARRAGALGEAALVYAGMMLAFRPLALAVGGGAAASAITQLTVFTVGSVSWILLLRRDPAGFGLRFETPGESFRLAFRAYSIVGPGCMIFLVVMWVGSGLDRWLGAAMVAAVFLAALPLVVRVTADLPTRSTAAGGSAGSTLAVVGLLALAAAGSVLTATSAPFVSRLLYYGLIVGFSEEIVFRGLLQSLLNRAFGRPWQWRGVRFGPGLLIAALLFGFAHPIVGSGFRLPLALFTTALGLIFGYLREKDGSVLAPAFLHGLADLPLVFFG
jgi:membrane protease YdiL (CAAX protease family)